MCHAIHTFIFQMPKRKVPETHIVFIAGVLIDLIQCNSLRGGQGIHFFIQIVHIVSLYQGWSHGLSSRSSSPSSSPGAGNPIRRRTHLLWRRAVAMMTFAHLRGENERCPADLCRQRNLIFQTPNPLSITFLVLICDLLYALSDRTGSVGWALGSVATVYRSSHCRPRAIHLDTGPSQS